MFLAQRNVIKLGFYSSVHVSQSVRVGEKGDNCHVTVHHLQVFYVDFGNTEWVRDVRVRQLDYRFMHLPFQAVECFLNVNPTRVGGWWTSKAKYV